MLLKKSNIMNHLSTSVSSYLGKYVQRLVDIACVSVQTNPGNTLAIIIDLLDTIIKYTNGVYKNFVNHARYDNRIYNWFDTGTFNFTQESYITLQKYYIRMINIHGFQKKIINLRKKMYKVFEISKTNTVCIKFGNDDLFKHSFMQHLANECKDYNENDYVQSFKRYQMASRNLISTNSVQIINKFMDSFEYMENALIGKQGY